MNGSVCRKKRIFLHPEHRLADWQVGPPVVGHGTLGEPVATGQRGGDNYELPLIFIRKIPNIDHIDYVYGSTGSRMRRIGRPACVLSDMSRVAPPGIDKPIC